MSIKPSNSSQSQYSSGRFCGVTDVGGVRTTNEDSFFIDEGRGIAIVADGMGGHKGGKMASEMAISRVMAEIVTQESTVISRDDAMALLDSDITNPNVMPYAMTVLSEAIQLANQDIFEHNREHGAADGQGMGTTITGLWQRTHDGPLISFNVGDSRVYRFRAGVLTQLTHDDSLIQYMLDSGINDSTANKNVLLKAVGPTALVEPTVRQFAAQANDYYLLCSDGLHGSLDDSVIANTIRGVYTQEPGKICQDLIAAAIAAGGTDNITAVLVASH